MRRSWLWLRAALLLLLLPFLFASTTAYVPGVVVECADAEERERIKDLSIEAIDHAYLEYVQQLYAVWMRDPHGQPQRAQAGVSKAVKAWLNARRGMESFQPRECL